MNGKQLFWRADAQRPCSGEKPDVLVEDLFNKEGRGRAAIPPNKYFCSLEKVPFAFPPSRRCWLIAEVGRPISELTLQIPQGSVLTLMKRGKSMTLG